MFFSGNSEIILPLMQKVMRDLGSVKKDSKNPHYRSSYADLNSHLDAVEPILEKHGLILLQPSGVDELGPYVMSIVVEPTSGQFIRSRMNLILTKQDMQQMGSAVTYARRYTLGSLLAMKAEDDDGNSASDVGRKPLVKSPSKPVKAQDEEF